MRLPIRKRGERVATPPIMGGDTETHYGYCRLMCIEGHTPRIQYRTGDWKGWTNYLLDTPTGRLAFFNLRFDVESILKHFPEKFIQNLLYLGEIELSFGPKTWAFRLIPWKFFSIKELVQEGDRRRSVRTVELFDAAQFYQTSLNNAAKQTLGKEKSEDTSFAADLNTSEKPWFNQSYRIIEYCQQDADLAGELIRAFMSAAKEAPLNLAPRNPISCAWYAKELIKQCIPETKKIKSMRTGQGHYYARPWKQWDNVGTQCYVGGRFEAFQKGSFQNVYNYDINSAYPDSIAKLPNPYNLAFIRDTQPEGNWSMVKAEVWVNESRIGPLPYRLPNTIIFPRGNWTGWFHWEELRNAADRFNVDFEIHKCLNGVEPDGPDRPFAKRIPEFFMKRAELKDAKDPRELPYKVAMNSVYGVFYEKNERILSDPESRTEIDGHLLKKQKDNPGRFAYPYLAGWVTSQTRIRVLNAAAQKPDAAIFVATDGVLSEEKLNLPISKKLGEWSMKEAEIARVFGNGMYELDGKIKTRGFRKDGARDKRPMRDRMRLATDSPTDRKSGHRPGDVLINSKDQGPIHLGMAFKLRDYSLKDALTWIDKDRDMNITQCDKRSWETFTVQDLYSRRIQSDIKTVEPGLNANLGLSWNGDMSIEADFTKQGLGNMKVEI